MRPSLASGGTNTASADETREARELARVGFPVVAARDDVADALNTCHDMARFTWEKRWPKETTLELEASSADSARWRRHSNEATLAAAARVDCETQALLSGRGTPTVELRLRPQIVRSQALAVAAVEEVLGTQARARAWLVNEHGRPRLTVCYGRGSQRIPSERVAVLRALDPEAEWPDPAYVGFLYGDGCGAIFRDSIRRLKVYCETCHKSRTTRQEENLQRAKRMVEGRFPHPPHDPRPNYWFGKCSSCGGDFADTNPKATRCAGCHR